MARIQSPLFGAASGSVAGLELYRLKGYNYARAAKLKRYKLKTVSQIAREQLFRQLNIALSALSPVLPNYSLIRKSRLSFQNYFIKRNYQYFSYNAHLNNIKCDNIPALFFFQYSQPVPISVSEWDYIPFSGFTAQISANHISMDYNYYLFGVRDGGREFAQLSGYCDAEFNFIFVEAFPFPPFNGQGFHVFMFASDWLNNRNPIEYQFYCGRIPPPK